MPSSWHQRATTSLAVTLSMASTTKSGRGLSPPQDGAYVVSREKRVDWRNLAGGVDVRHDAGHHVGFSLTHCACVGHRLPVDVARLNHVAVHRTRDPHAAACRGFCAVGANATKPSTTTQALASLPTASLPMTSSSLDVGVSNVSAMRSSVPIVHPLAIVPIIVECMRQRDCPFVSLRLC